MNSTASKPRLLISTVYEYAADHFAQKGDRSPSHCDVRCVCNDILESYERDGYTVPHGYSQDKAHREVRAILRNC